MHSWLSGPILTLKLRKRSVAAFSSALQCLAVCCSVLQCVAVCCSVLKPDLDSDVAEKAGVARVVQFIACALQSIAAVAACCCALQRGAVYCSALWCVATCSTMRSCFCCLVLISKLRNRSVAACCSVLQRVAACSSVLQPDLDSVVAGKVGIARALQPVAVCCSVLQCVATCSVMQSWLSCPILPPTSPTRWIESVLQCVMQYMAVRYSVLRCAAV